MVGSINASHRTRPERLAKSFAVPAMTMASGAGHDSAVFGNMGVPTAMIFVRNEHASHNPNEAMDLADFAQGLRLLIATIVCVDIEQYR